MRAKWDLGAAWLAQNIAFHTDISRWKNIEWAPQPYKCQKFDQPLILREKMVITKLVDLKKICYSWSSTVRFDISSLKKENQLHLFRVALLRPYAPNKLIFELELHYSCKSSLRFQLACSVTATRIPDNVIILMNTIWLHSHCLIVQSGWFLNLACVPSLIT